MGKKEEVEELLSSNTTVDNCAWHGIARLSIRILRSNGVEPGVVTLSNNNDGNFRMLV